MAGSGQRILDALQRIDQALQRQQKPEKGEIAPSLSAQGADHKEAGQSEAVASEKKRSRRPRKPKTPKRKPSVSRPRAAENTLGRTGRANPGPGELGALVRTLRELGEAREEKRVERPAAPGASVVVPTATPKAVPPSPQLPNRSRRKRKRPALKPRMALQPRAVTPNAPRSAKPVTAPMSSAQALPPPAKPRELPARAPYGTKRHPYKIPGSEKPYYKGQFLPRRPQSLPTVGKQSRVRPKPSVAPRETETRKAAPVPTSAKIAPSLSPARRARVARKTVAVREPRRAKTSQSSPLPIRRVRTQTPSTAPLTSVARTAKGLTIREGEARRETGAKPLLPSSPSRRRALRVKRSRAPSMSTRRLRTQTPPVGPARPFQLQRNNPLTGGHENTFREMTELLRRMVALLESQQNEGRQRDTGQLPPADERVSAHGGMMPPLAVGGHGSDTSATSSIRSHLKNAQKAIGAIRGAWHLYQTLSR